MLMAERALFNGKFLMSMENVGAGDTEGQTRESPFHTPPPAPISITEAQIWLQNQPIRNYPKALRIYKTSESLPPGSLLRVTLQRPLPQHLDNSAPLPRPQHHPKPGWEAFPRNSLPETLRHSFASPLVLSMVSCTQCALYMCLVSPCLETTEGQSQQRERDTELAGATWVGGTWEGPPPATP